MNAEMRKTRRKEERKEGKREKNTGNKGEEYGKREWEIRDKERK